MDSEIEAMARVADALKDLNTEQIRRVLSWASDKYGVQARSTGPVESRRLEVAASRAPSFEALADLYDAANPTTDAEKLLVVSYWFQVVQGTTELESLTLNKELKNLGHPVGNITRAFAGLAQAVPRLVIQTRKTGSTRQARKRFKLTVEGIRRVGQLLGEARVGVVANGAGDGVAPQ